MIEFTRAQVPLPDALFAKARARYFEIAGVAPSARAFVYTEAAERAEAWRDALTDKLRGLPFAPGVDDDEVCKVARGYAKECREKLSSTARHRDTVQATDRHGRTTTRRGSLIQTDTAGGDYDALYMLRDVFKKAGIRPRFGKVTPDGIIKRACCELWWRRQFRRAAIRKLEHAAILIGAVHGAKGGGKYASNEACHRRHRQNMRNAATLADTQIANDEGSEYTLSELAALSTANKAIRRGEVMTRLRGFDDLANRHKHAGVMVTLTLPSRFHAVLSGSGAPNPKYEPGLTPRHGQEALRAVWSRVRAAAHRRGIRLYGLRVAEPHHDGCTHWHMFMFCAQEGERTEAAHALAAMSFRHLLRYEALKDEPDEPGARDVRVKVEALDRAKGSAAAYAAKYVAKHVGANMDRFCGPVQMQIDGTQMLATHERVEAWATLWGIRQWQTVGAVPIGLWRTARRVTREVIEHAPKQLQLAWEHAQRIEHEGETIKPADYGAFVDVCGGPTVGRKTRIQHTWERVKRESRYDGRQTINIATGLKWAETRAAHNVERRRWVWGDPARFARPWTRVNNCTQPATAPRDFGAPAVPIPTTYRDRWRAAHPI